jgi:hypothetical protein
MIGLGDTMAGEAGKSLRALRDKLMRLELLPQAVGSH